MEHPRRIGILTHSVASLPFEECLRTQGREFFALRPDGEPVSQVDAALVLLLHREDPAGVLQTVLEWRGIAHCGPGALTTRLCSHPLLLRRLLSQGGVPTPRFQPLSEFGGAHLDLARIQTRLHFPLVALPAENRFSFEPTVLENEETFLDIVPRLRELSPRLLVEELVLGQRMMVQALGQECMVASSPPLSPNVEASLRQTVARALGCVETPGLAQIELTLDSAGIVWILAIDPMPNLDPKGEFCLQAQRAGIRFDELVQRLIEQAARRMHSKTRKQEPWLSASSARF